MLPRRTLPEILWPHEVDRGFSFLKRDAVPADTPSFASVVAYYQHRAPESLPVLEQPVDSGECPVRFGRAVIGLARVPSPGVANVRFVHLSDDGNSTCWPAT